MLKENSKTITNNQQLAEKFKNLFSSIVQNLGLGSSLDCMLQGSEIKFNSKVNLLFFPV